MSFAWRQLQSAIRSLTIGGDRRSRLACAYSKLVRLKPRDLPSEVAEDFSRLLERISRYPAKGIGSEVRREVKSMTEAEIDEATQRIMRMYDAVASYQPCPTRHPGGAPRDQLDGWPIPAVQALGKRAARDLRDAIP